MLSVEWKTDGASSQEVRILHRGARAGRGEEAIAGRKAHGAQPLTRPSFVLERRENNTSRQWDGRFGFIGNGLRFAILLVGLGVPTFSRAALVGAMGDNAYGPPRLPVGGNNISAIATVGVESESGVTVLGKGSLPLRDLGASPWPQRFYRIVEHWRDDEHACGHKPRRIRCASERTLTNQHPKG